jgi:hypothetical protein
MVIEDAVVVGYSQRSIGWIRIRRLPLVRVGEEYRRSAGRTLGIRYSHSSHNVDYCVPVGIHFDRAMCFSK